MKKLFLVFLLMAATAQAETYQWTDKDGTIHFSDSLGSEPAAYRKSAVHVDADTEAAPAPAPAREKAPAAAAPQGKQSLPDNAAISSQVQGMKEQMMNDEGVMNLVMGMQNDPDLQAILNDPAVMQAVQAGDIGTLLNNPAFMKLLSNPKVQEIGKRMQQAPSAHPSPP